MNTTKLEKLNKTVIDLIRQHKDCMKEIIKLMSENDDEIVTSLLVSEYEFHCRVMENYIIMLTNISENLNDKKIKIEV